MSGYELQFAQNPPVESDASVTFFQGAVMSVGNQVVEEAYSEGRRDAAAELQVVGAQISAILDSSTCEFCYAKDGLTIDLRTEEGMRLLDENNPPFHGNCRCELVYIEPEESFENDNADFNEKFMDKFSKLDPTWKDRPEEELRDYLDENFYSTLTPRKQALLDEKMNESVDSSLQAAMKRIARDPEMWDDFTAEDVPEAMEEEGGEVITFGGPGSGRYPAGSGEKAGLVRHEAVDSDTVNRLVSGTAQNLEGAEDTAKFFKQPKFNEWEKGLSRNEATAIHSYTGTESCYIWNEHLRTGEEIKMGRDGKKLSKFEIKYEKIRMNDFNEAVNKCTLPEDMTLYRGISVVPESIRDITQLPDKYVGAIITEPGFMSTSTTQSVATDERFLGDKDSLLFKILAPAGTRAAPLKSFSKYAYENEVVFPTNTGLQIHSVEKIQHGGKNLNMVTVIAVQNKEVE